MHEPARMARPISDTGNRKRVACAVFADNFNLVIWLDRSVGIQTIVRIAECGKRRHQYRKTQKQKRKFVPTSHHQTLPLPRRKVKTVCHLTVNHWQVMIGKPHLFDNMPKILGGRFDL
jgi:hypothetical protein